MSSTNILTFDQGITLLIETGFFFIFYYIYHITFGEKMPFTNVIFTTFIFSLWLLTVTVFSNLTLALNVPLARTSNVPFHNE